ncbi:MAG: type IV pilus secretin PilQ [Thermodesulfobacteriota bacterium]
MNIKQARYNVFRAEGQKRDFKNIYPQLSVLISVIFVIFLTGCGPQRVAKVDKDVPGLTTIKTIGVVGEGDSILIEAAGKIKYTAFNLMDPPRLIIDMPDANLDNVDKPMAVNNDFITEIDTSTYGYGDKKIGRIEVGLKEGIEHEIKVGEDRLTVKLTKSVFISGFAAEQPVEAEEVKAEMVEPVMAEEDILVSESWEVEAEDRDVDIEIAPEEDISEGWDLGEETITVSSGKADKILKIEATGVEEGTIVKIITNGSPDNYNSFGLESPARLVIDIWGVESLVQDKTIDVDDINVKRIRIGDHPGKSRIVIDSSRDILPPYSIDKVDNTLMVRFGDVSKEAAVGEMDILKETPEVIKPEEEWLAMEDKREVKRDIEIGPVVFKSLDDNARLKITTSEKAQYKVSKSIDASIIALDFKDAYIPNAMSRILDASELQTPVLSIGSFQVSEEPISVVRVLVKLKEPSEYSISQESNAVYVDLPIKREEEVVLSEQDTLRGTAIKYKGRKISLDLKDADITNVLRLIAEVSELNIISGDDVRGKISLRLIDVPWDQAFDIILKTKGLARVHEGNVVRVALIAKIKQEEDALLAAMKASERLDPLELKLIPVNYAEAGELASQVKNLLSERGTVSTEKRTNTLIIRDIKANIEEALKIVEELDSPTPQVLIETRIVEAQTNFFQDLGIQWGIAHATQNTDRFSSTFGSSGTDPPSTFPEGRTGFIGTGGTFTEQPNFAVNLPATGSAGILGALGFAFGKLTGDPLLLDIRISAGEQRGLTKTISRPRIATLDNKEAKISQGERVPFETTSSTGTQTEFIDAELELSVTPHITPDGSVAMKIQVTRNSIGSFRSANGTPSINTKEASTEILIKDGETAVIGGIVVSDNSNSKSGIPFFNKIPIIGWLFKSRSISDTQTELLIFITPTIMKEGETA